MAIDNLLLGAIVGVLLAWRRRPVRRCRVSCSASAQGAQLNAPYSAPSRKKLSAFLKHLHGVIRRLRLLVMPNR